MPTILLYWLSYPRKVSGVSATHVQDAKEIRSKSSSSYLIMNDKMMLWLLEVDFYIENCKYVMKSLKGSVWTS